MRIPVLLSAIFWSSSCVIVQPTHHTERIETSQFVMIQNLEGPPTDTDLVCPYGLRLDPARPPRLGELPPGVTAEQLSFILMDHIEAVDAYWDRYYERWNDRITILEHVC